MELRKTLHRFADDEIAPHAAEADAQAEFPWPSYLAYAITFLLIGQVWANHHVMFDHIRSADRMVLFLNTCC